MTVLVSEDQVWALPGPDRWMRRIVSALRRRQHLLLDLPSIEGPQGVLEALEDALDRTVFECFRSVGLDELPLGCPTQAELLRSLSARVFDDERHGASPREFIDEAPGGGLLVAVDLRGGEPSQVGDLVRSLDALGRTLNAPCHVVLVVLIDTNASFEELNALRLESWRHALEPLDALVFASNYASESAAALDPRLLSVLGELAGTDLELIAACINGRWNGEMGTLERLVESRWDRRCLDPRVLDGVRDVELWRLNCDSGSAKAPRRAIDLPMVRSQIGVGLWRAQVNVLFSTLEDHRLFIIEEARRRNQQLFLSELTADGTLDDAEQAEIGQLFRLRGRFLAAEGYITWLRSTRNALAHRRHVPFQELTRGDQLRERLSGSSVPRVG